MSKQNGTGRRQGISRLRRERQELFSRLQEAQNLLAMQESWYNSWGTGPYGWKDQVGWSGGEPGGRWLPIGAGSGQGRQHGNNGPFIETEEELSQARNVARMLAQRNPIAIGIVETIKDFVVGEGMYPLATSKEGANDWLVAEVQDVLDTFVDDNLYDEFQQELVGREVVEGEYFERYHPHDDQLQVRVVEAEHVTKPEGLSDDWSWGIHNPPGDVSRALEYAVNYGVRGEEVSVDAADIQHVKCNVVRNVKRGLSDFYATDQQLEQVKKLLTCMVVGEGIKAAIPGFWQYETASKSSVQDHIAAKRDQNQALTTDPITGKNVNATRYEPGSILHVPKGKTFVAMPNSQGTANHVATVQAVLRSLAVRWGFPENLISADASNNNFASILVANAPFVRRVKRWQKFNRTRWLRSFWMAVRVAHAAGRFGRNIDWPTLKFLIDIQLEGSTPEMANDLELAQTSEIEHRNGILSKQTWRQRRGLDNEIERKNLKEEPAAAPDQGGVNPLAALLGRPPVRESRVDLTECGGPGGTPGPCKGELADGKEISFVPHENAAGPGYTLVTVNPAKLDAAFKQAGPDQYIPPGGGGGEIKGRREGFERFLATGQAVQAPKVGLDPSGKATFEDGRHRFSVLRDKGIKAIPISVPKEEAAQIRKLYEGRVEGGSFFLSALRLVREANGGTMRT